MNDLIKQSDTQYHKRSRYGVELDEGGKVKCLNKKLYYRQNYVHKIQYKLIWTWIILMARISEEIQNQWHVMNLYKDDSVLLKTRYFWRRL